MKLLVCIPTLHGRGQYLMNCLKGYNDRTSFEMEVRYSTVFDAPSCGVGWQRAVDLGLLAHPDADFIHFSNDDIVVAEGWLEPLVEAVNQGYVPASRIEPAGVALGIDGPMPEVPPMAPAEPRPTEHGYFYSDLPENQPKLDWQLVDHCSLPFCHRDQWEAIKPFIPIHFGTDKWFHHRARQAGFLCCARQGSVIYNYAAPIGRSKGEWTEQDFLDFDLTVAYPLYLTGVLAPEEEHPGRLTPEALAYVRAWRKATFG